MKIFISHIHEDGAIATVLKKWIEAGFPNQCQVLTSGDPQDLPDVAKWLEKVDQTLESLKILILICSPQAIQKPWISFEAGSAWSKKISIFTICHSGITIANLPQPLFMFPGLDLDQKDFPQTLLFTLCKEFGISQLPRLPFREMRDEIKRFLPSTQQEGAKETAMEASTELREQIFEDILLLLANTATLGFTATVLGEHFNLQEQKMTQLLKKLIDGQFVYASPPSMGHTRYNLTNKGKEYLRGKGLL